jgi:hypothetical protein
MHARAHGKCMWYAQACGASHIGSSHVLVEKASDSADYEDDEHDGCGEGVGLHVVARRLVLLVHPLDLCVCVCKRVHVCACVCMCVHVCAVGKLNPQRSKSPDTWKRTRHRLSLHLFLSASLTHSLTHTLSLTQVIKSSLLWLCPRHD